MPLKDIPSFSSYSSEAFLCAGNALSVVFDVMETRLNAKDRGIDIDSAIEHEYNKACQHRLRTALVFTQQAYEMYFRALICEVSPYLLLPDTEWIKRAASGSQSFSELRSVNANDLPNLVKSVSTRKLEESIFVNFDQLRRLRNQLVHATPDIKIEERILLRQLAKLFSSMGWRNLLAGFTQYEATSHAAILFDPYLELNRAHAVLDAVRDQFGHLFADEILLSIHGAADGFCSTCFVEFETPSFGDFQKTCLISEDFLNCAICETKSAMLRLPDRRTLFFDIPEKRHILALAGDGQIIGIVGDRERLTLGL